MPHKKFVESLVRDASAVLASLGAQHEVRWVVDESTYLAEKMPDRASFEETARKSLQKILERRKSGEPLAYIFGHWAFREHEFKVGPGALIPRPETEELVEFSLKAAPRRSPLRVADLGAGTGCIGISYAFELSRARPQDEIQLFLVERSPEARTWLEQNVATFRPLLSKVSIEVVPCAWEDWEASILDVILSNPPYVTEDEAQKLESSVVDFEPRQALVPFDETRWSDASGPYRSILEFSARHLAPGGQLWLEFGVAQVARLEGIARQTGLFSESFVIKDMAGKDRILRAIRGATD